MPGAEEVACGPHNLTRNLACRDPSAVAGSLYWYVTKHLSDMNTCVSM